MFSWCSCATNWASSKNWKFSSKEVEGFSSKERCVRTHTCRHFTDWVARVRVGVWLWYSSHGFQVISFNGRAKNQSGPAQNQVVEVTRIPNINTLWTHDQKFNFMTSWNTILKLRRVSSSILVCSLITHQGQVSHSDWSMELDILFPHRKLWGEQTGRQERM